MTLSEVKPITGYEVYITKDQNGRYTGQVKKNGSYLSGSTTMGTRDEVIAESKKFMEWHKSGGEQLEVVPL